jgi:hypothetical protein
MSEKLSETALVRALADQAARSVTRKTIAPQKRTETTSAEDSGPKSVWDEICIQIQYEGSTFWDAYDQTVRAILQAYVEEMPQFERESIWLQTNAGGDWDCGNREDREDYPVFDGDIVDYLARKYVKSDPDRWSNTCIRAFLDLSRMRD